MEFEVNKVVEILANPANPAGLLPAGASAEQCQKFTRIFEKVKDQLEPILGFGGEWDIFFPRFDPDFRAAEDAMRRTSKTLSALVNDQSGFDEAVLESEAVFAVEYCAHYFKAIDVLLDGNLALENRLLSSEEIFRHGLACETAFLIHCHLINVYENKAKGASKATQKKDEKYEQLMCFVDGRVDELTKSTRQTRSVRGLLILILGDINRLDRGHEALGLVREGADSNKLNSDLVPNNRVRNRIRERLSTNRKLSGQSIAKE